MSTVLTFLIPIIICLIAGGIGSVFTVPAIPTWYAALQKPPFNPPNWLFAPVWTTLYVLMGVSAGLVWRQGFQSPAVRNGLLLFAIQLVLNVLWSFLFFGLHSPLFGLIGIVLLWIAILLTILSFFPISRPAAWLLVSYILWVSFATVLNFSILLLNPPSGF